MSPLDDSLRWKKLYTPESMSLKGKFELKDVNDAFVTNEKEVQRHNARVRQADYRERKKEKQDVGFPSSPLTTSPPPAGSPDRATKRRKVVHPGVWACDVHNDPDCVEDECFAQIFEEWDPLDEVTGIRTEENRFDPGLVYRAGPPAGLPKLEIKTGERENLWCRRLGVAFAHRNVGVTIKPYLRKRIRQLLRHTGDYPAFKDLSMF